MGDRFRIRASISPLSPRERTNRATTSITRSCHIDDKLVGRAEADRSGFGCSSLTVPDASPQVNLLSQAGSR